MAMLNNQRVKIGDTVGWFQISSRFFSSLTVSGENAHSIEKHPLELMKQEPWKLPVWCDSDLPRKHWMTVRWGFRKNGDRANQNIHCLV